MAPGNRIAHRAQTGRLVGSRLRSAARAVVPSWPAGLPERGRAARLPPIRGPAASHRAGDRSRAPPPHCRRRARSLDAPAVPARRTAQSLRSPAVSSSTGASSALGSASGGIGKRCSPLSRKGVRLVTRIVNLGHAARRSARSFAASNRCSKLSSTSSRRRSRKAATRLAARGWSDDSRTASERAIGRQDEVRTGHREQGGRRWTPAAKRSATSSATRRASRVLPTPPGPVSVTRRTSSRHRRSATACDLPLATDEAGERYAGRLVSDPCSFRGRAIRGGAADVGSWGSTAGAPVARQSDLDVRGTDPGTPG